MARAKIAATTSARVAAAPDDPSWVANGSGASGDWTDPTHWDTGVVPTPGDNVDIGQGITAAPGWVVSVGDESTQQLALAMQGGTLSVGGALGIAYQLDMAGGTLLGADGGVVTAETATLDGGGVVSLDAGGGVALGGVASVGGAVALGGVATLSATDGVIDGNVVDDGVVSIDPAVTFPFEVPAQVPGTLDISGALTGSGLVAFGLFEAASFGAPTTDTAQFGRIDGFTGTLDINGNATVFAGDAPLATVELGRGSTLDLAGIAYTGQAPSYDAATGVLGIGTAEVGIGLGKSASLYEVSSDGAGGTELFGRADITWQANSVGPGGDWSDASHWDAGVVPTSADTVEIGPGMTQAAPWTVTVSEASFARQLDLTMGIGVLAVSAELNVGTLDLVSGAMVVDGVPEFSATTFEESGAGRLSVNASSLYTDSALLNPGGTVTLSGGATWTTTELTLGLVQASVAGGAPATIDLSQSILRADDTVSIGSLAAGEAAAGVLNLTDAGVVTAQEFVLAGRSALSIDPTSGMEIGPSPTGAQFGTVVVDALGAFDVVGAATMTGNIEDQGGTVFLGADSVSGTADNTGLALSGRLSGDGIITVASDATIGYASGFTGTLDIANSLTLLTGEATLDTLIFEPGATLDLRGIAFSDAPPGYDAGTGVLHVGAVALAVGGGLSASDFSVMADASGGTEVVRAGLPCYAAGTLIATRFGDTPVEVLRPGDMVRTAAGPMAPVVWVGWTRVDLRRHPEPWRAAPIRVAAGAFAPNLPARDLFVSPDHALLVGDALIPAHRLVNGASIARDDGAEAVTYVHVELARHDLLLAEGLPAESFLDTGNRGQFAGECGARPLHPDFIISGPDARRCAPLVTDGPILAAAHAALLARAGALGHVLTDGPALLLGIDAAPLFAVSDEDDGLELHLPPGARAVRLRSRVFVPEDFDPSRGDGRRLGVAVVARLNGRKLPRAAYASGWHAPEPDTDWRWTDGDAVLAFAPRAAPSRLTLRRMRAGAQYWRAPPTPWRRAG